MNKKTAKKKAPSVKDITYTRDEMRARLLGNVPKPKRKTVKLFNIKLDLVQPSLDIILDTQHMTDMKERSVQMIIEYACVPGTEERIFEPTDKDVILNWPFDDDVVALQMAITELTGVDIEAAEEELKKNPLKERQ